jgi:hypothetical protein
MTSWQTALEWSVLPTNLGVFCWISQKIWPLAKKFGPHIKLTHKGQFGSFFKGSLSKTLRKN